MIRVLTVDDHPAIRAGLTAVLDAEPDLVPVGTAAREHDLWPALTTTRPDVVVLDFHLPGRDGLLLCRQIKDRLDAPKVLLYSVNGGVEMRLPAIVAGADGLLEKGAPTIEVCNAIRTVAGGTGHLERPAYDLVDAACSQVDRADVPIVDLLLQGASRRELCATLALRAEEVAERTDRILRALGAQIVAG